MDNDELLTDDNPEVEKVKWLEDGDVPVIPPPIIETPVTTPQNDVPLILGATFGILALLLGGLLLRKKQNFTEAVVAPPPKKTSSFVGPTNLGVVASAMDVHECKSAACPKCYENPGVCFIHAPNKGSSPPPRAFVEDGICREIPPAWKDPSLSSSSSFESSSTTEFYS